jgi:hypothetical protein
MSTARPARRGRGLRALYRVLKFAALGLVMGAMAGASAELYFHMSYARKNLAGPDLSGQLSWSEFALIALTLGLAGTAGGLITRSERRAILGFLYTTTLTVAVALGVSYDRTLVSSLLLAFCLAAGGGLGIVTGRGFANRLMLAVSGLAGALAAYEVGLRLMETLEKAYGTEHLLETAPAVIMGASLGGSLGLVIWTAIGVALPLFRAKPVAGMWDRSSRRAGAASL